MLHVISSLTSGVIIVSLGHLSVGVGLHLACDGAHDAQLGEQRDSLRALELGGAAGEVVDATQADFRLLRLQHHHVALSVQHRHTGLLVETSGNSHG